MNRPVVIPPRADEAPVACSRGFLGPWKIAYFIIAFFALALLNGCSGPIGTALAGFAGAGTVLGGQALLDRGAEDIEAKILWRAKRKEIVTLALNSKMRLCLKLDGSVLENTCYEDVLKFWDTQHPETLVMELRRRAKAPEPQIVAPAN